MPSVACTHSEVRHDTHSDGLESLLASSIKQLQLNFLAIKLDGSELEIDTDGWCAVHVYIHGFGTCQQYREELGTVKRIL